jgi:hypothetical protein
VWSPARTIKFKYTNITKSTKRGTQ